MANTAWAIVNFRLELIHALIDAKYELIVMASNDGYETKIPEKVHFIPLKNLKPTGKNPWTDYRLISEIEHHLKSNRVDLLLTFTPKANIYGCLSARRAHTLCIPTVNGLGRVFNTESILKSIVLRLYKLAFNKLQIVIFQNQDDADFFSQKGIVSKDQIHRIAGSGVNLSIFQPKAEDEPAKDTIILTYAGRLLPEKGVFDYIKAVRRIADRSNCKFQLVGRTANHRNTRIENEVSHLCQQAKIEYLGSTDRIAEYLRQVDVFVFPSYYREGIPKVLLEALATGLPIITTNSVGCKETVEHGKNGWLVPPMDHHALGDAIDQAIAASASSRKEFGQQSRKLAEMRFDVKDVVERYMHLSQTILTDSNKKY
ncbi:MAG: glycosyltransferase family 4 protein [Bacteroidota bacterium]